MTCWWCRWGWPKPIADIFDEALRRLCGSSGPLYYGPAHVVWDDENWNDAQWCLDHFDEFRGDYSDEDLAVVRWSLEALLRVDAEYKVEPAGYDDEHPEKFPPPAHWVMVRRP